MTLRYSDHSRFAKHSYCWCSYVHCSCSYMLKCIKLYDTYALLVLQYGALQYLRVASLRVPVMATPHDYGSASRQGAPGTNYESFIS
eukprot:scaffold338063_cov19-Prasinocladus_malaysianus.AAC.1